MATITFNTPDLHKQWLQSKNRAMTDIINQLIEEKMLEEDKTGQYRFLPKQDGGGHRAMA